MRIVVCGSAGQLAGDIIDVLREHGDEVYGFDLDLDITDFSLVMREVPTLQPDLVINAAAYVDADDSELNPERCYRINFTGTQNLALACQEIGCPIVFFSSDYVFDGQKGSSYSEFDEPNPQGVYGIAKLQAERYIQSVLSKYYICRCQWLFGTYGKRNFVKSILHKAQTEGQISVVTDEVGSPSYCRDVAEIVIRLAKSGRYGVYHTTNSGICSRYDFAREILEIAGMSGVPVKPILYKNLSLPCPRPPFSPLDNLNLRLQGFSPARPYQDGLQEYVEWLLKEGQ